MNSIDPTDYTKVTSEYEQKILKAKKVAFPFCLIAFISTLFLFGEIFFLNIDFDMKVIYMIVLLSYLIGTFANLFYGYHKTDNKKRQKNLKIISEANASVGNLDSALYTNNNMNYNYIPKYGSMQMYGFYALLILASILLPIVFYEINFYNLQLIIYLIYIYIIQFYPITKCSCLIYSINKLNTDTNLNDLVKKEMNKTIKICLILFAISLFILLQVFFAI